MAVQGLTLGNLPYPSDSQYLTYAKGTNGHGVVIYIYMYTKGVLLRLGLYYTYLNQRHIMLHIGEWAMKKVQNYQ